MVALNKASFIKSKDVWEGIKKSMEFFSFWSFLKKNTLQLERIVFLGGPELTSQYSPLSSV